MVLTGLACWTKSDRLGVSEGNGDFQKEAEREFDEKRV